MFKELSTRLFMPYFSAQLCALCGLYLIHDFFNPEDTECSRELSTRLFMPYFSAQLCALCGLYLIHDFLTAEDAEDAECSRELFTNLFMPYFSAQLCALCGLFLIHDFLTQRTQSVQGNYPPDFLCHISLRSSALSAVYTLFMVFLPQRTQSIQEELHSILKNQCFSFFGIELDAIVAKNHFTA